MRTALEHARPAGRLVAPPRLNAPRLAPAAAIALAFTVPALLATGVGGLTELLSLDMDRLAAGEMWRVVTGHWVHWSLDHLIWSGGAFALLMLIGWRLDRTMTLMTLVASAILIPCGLQLLMPDLATYGGLSGIDSALFVFVALTLLIREAAARRWLVPGALLLLLAGFVGKVVFEFVTGQTLFASSTGMVGVPAAHTIGGACGAMTVVTRRLCRAAGTRRHED